MKLDILGALVMVLLLAGCGSSEDKNENLDTICDYVTFVRFGGVLYTPSYANKDVAGVVLGPEHGAVSRSLSDRVNNCYEQRGDGDAFGLAVGTKLYEVEGYEPEFLLATASDGRVYQVWEANSAPGSSFGRDLLDVEGGVSKISLLSQVDSTTELGAIDDPVVVQEFIAALGAAPVDQNADQQGDILRYFVKFEMKDGLSFTRIYRPDTGELAGTMLPESVRAMLEDALSKRIPATVPYP